MGNDKADTMKAVLTAAVLLISVLNTALFATACEQYEDAYSIAQYKMNETDKRSYRESYDLVNAVIDSGIVYLAYCKEQIPLGDQYQIRQIVKRGDEKRREYFIGAVNEYHAIYGIRPNVTEIYQDGSSSGGSGTSKGRSQSPPRFPPVPQPMMPPVQH
ncbi:MAG: hypothetical protein MUP09_05140 [Thiovulaceae bacterium]|nr:hypothetical protein [Sulfurimonadaceae bacterium]